MSTRVPGLPMCWRVLPIIPPRGCTSYCPGTGAGFRQPLTPPDPQLRWRIQFYVIDPSLSPGYGRSQAVLRGWIRNDILLITTTCGLGPYLFASMRSIIRKR